MPEGRGRGAAVAAGVLAGAADLVAAGVLAGAAGLVAAGVLAGGAGLVAARGHPRRAGDPSPGGTRPWRAGRVPPRHGPDLAA